jgi:IS605 OrfB family transposase
MSRELNYRDLVGSIQFVPKFHGALNFIIKGDGLYRRDPRQDDVWEEVRMRDAYLELRLGGAPESLMFLAVEDLKNLKRGKAPNRSRAFRRAASPWTYRQVLQVMTQKAQENGVLLVAVPPQYTSQECPSCGTVDRRNRVAGCFKCVNCGHTQHADTVGAINILNKAIRKAGSLESPALKAS